MIRLMNGYELSTCIILFKRFIYICPKTHVNIKQDSELRFENFKVNCHMILFIEKYISCLGVEPGK